MTAKAKKSLAEEERTTTQSVIIYCTNLFIKHGREIHRNNGPSLKDEKDFLDLHYPLTKALTVPAVTQFYCSSQPFRELNEQPCYGTLKGNNSPHISKDKTNTAKAGNN